MGLDEEPAPNPDAAPPRRLVFSPEAGTELGSVKSRWDPGRCRARLDTRAQATETRPIETCLMVGADRRSYPAF